MKGYAIAPAEREDARKRRRVIGFMVGSAEVISMSCTS
jgi:hypothetical protein